MADEHIDWATLGRRLYEELGRVARERADLNGDEAYGEALLDQDEPLVMVEVTNSTQEPDGTWKSYMLRVPPTVQTCQQAVAWTFGVDEREYAPAAES